MSRFTEADRARLIDQMCMTWRHDFGLDKEGRHELSSGMTEDERNALRRSMGQIFEHNILPLLAVPEGYALVPIEPTKAMLFACEDAGSIHNQQRGKRIYQAMLAAAPERAK